ncbi:MAG: hypothetical protein AB7O98_04990 [Hyphomonadaceae bacterium]
MRLVLAAAFIATMAAAPLAFAQADRSGGTQAFVNMCVARAANAPITTPEPTCACGAGVISGRMTDRQFDIMRQLAPYTGDQPAMNNAVRNMLAQGYAAEEIGQVGQMLIDLGPVIQSTCAVLER